MERVEISRKRFTENLEACFNMIENGTQIVLKWGKKKIVVMEEKDDACKVLPKQASPYNRGYVDMIRQAEDDIKSGKGEKIAIEDLWK
jgi:hypothetical protein